RVSRVGPAAEDREAGLAQLIGSVLGEQLAPELGSRDRLVATGGVVGRALGPFDGGVNLTDLGEGPRGVGGPCRHPPVTDMRADDGVDVAVVDGESALEFIKDEACVRERHLRLWRWTQIGAD